MRRKSRTLLWSATVLYVLLLTVVSLLPSGAAAPGGWDSSVSPTVQNLLHVPAFAVLFWLLTAVWRAMSKGWPTAITVSALISLLYGAALEFAQTAIPGRTGSLDDVLLNTVGVAGAASLAWVLGRPWARIAPSRDMADRQSPPRQESL